MSDEKVTPFRRRDEPGPLPPGEAALSRRVRQAQPGARALAARQAADHQAAYGAALGRQEAERLISAGRVVPARITIALDLCGLYGPEVDAQCDAAEPDVDMWEAGLAAPAPGQVEKLAALTGFPVVWFYRPVPAGPFTSSPVFMCGPGGCQVTAPDVITEDGVLLPEGRPRKVPAVQGALF